MDETKTVIEQMGKYDSPALVVLSVLVMVVFITLGWVVRAIYKEKKESEIEHAKQIIELSLEYNKKIESEREFIKTELKDMVGIFNDLSKILNQLGYGIEKELPEKLHSTNKLIESKSDEIKSHVSLMANSK